MTPKEYLRQYRDALARAERYRERIDQIEETLGITGSSEDGMPRGTTTSNPTAAAAVDLADKKARLNAQLLHAEQIRQKIEDQIDAVEGAGYQELLRARYLRGSSWAEVTESVSRVQGREYGEDHVRGRMHGEALARFGEMFGPLERFSCYIE